MKIRGLIWLDEIVDKLEWKHKINRQEVRDVFSLKPRIRFVEKGHRKGENLYVALGKTEQGRYLTVFFVLRKDNQGLVISARDMTQKERKYYGKK